MSSTKDLTKEVSDRKMQRLIPLLGEKYSKFRIQLWILAIGNSCNSMQYIMSSSKCHCESSLQKNNKNKQKRTKPVSPILLGTLQQIRAIE